MQPNDDVQRAALIEALGSGGGGAVLNAFEREACPRCGSGQVKRCGYDLRGVQRYRCHACSRTFTPLTGTMLDGCKLPLPAWVEFLSRMLSCENTSIPEALGVFEASGTTVRYWTGKVLAVLAGIQAGIMLGGRVQIDEILYPSPGKTADASLRSRMCIGVGCDDSGRSVFAYEGLGKTSGAKTMAAFGDHIVPRSVLVHDHERGHSRLVRILDLESEVHGSVPKPMRAGPDDPLRDVHRLCGRLKSFLDVQPAVEERDVEGLLGLFSVMANPPSGNSNKVKMVLEHAMSNPKSIRYRDFFKNNA